MKKISHLVMMVLLCIFLTACGSHTGGQATNGGTSGEGTNGGSPAETNAYEPQVAMNNNGNAVIVWRQSDGTNNQIFKSEFRDGTWDTYAALTSATASTSGTDVDRPRSATDSNGNVVVVWQQTDGINSRIYKSEYRNGAWNTPAVISTDTTNPSVTKAYEPQVAMDNNGNAIIAWQQAYGPDTRIYKSEYRNGAWDTPATMSTAGVEADTPWVAMNDSGDAVVVWQQSEVDNNRIVKNEYRNGAWDTPATMTTGGVMASPQAAMDNRGDVVLVWQEFDVTVKANQIFMSDYRYRDNIGAWTWDNTLSDICTDGYDAESPQIAMDSNGNAIIVWQENNGTYNQIYKREYRNGAWDTSSPGISISPDGFNAENPQIAQDTNGNAVIVWRQFDGAFNRIGMCEYRNALWSDWTLISTAGVEADSPQVAMNNNGNAVIVWQQAQGSNQQIFKSEYGNGAWNTPVDISPAGT
jgi:hypothetical protein